MADAHYGLRLLLLVFIVAVNAFFAAAEVALLTVRESRLRQLVEEGQVGAQAALSLLANPERLLSVVQVGVTLASLGLGWAGEDTLYGLLLSLFRPILTPESSHLLHGLSFTIAFLGITYAHVVMGEVVPKNLAVEKADRLALIVAPALLVFYRVSAPFVSVIETSAAAISRLLGVQGERGGGHTAEELRHMVSAGKLPEFQEDMIHGVLDLGNLYVREIMVPRNEIVSLPVNATLDQILEVVLSSRLTRIPVYEERPEHIIGILHAKDFLRIWLERRAALRANRPSREFRVRSLLRKPLFLSLIHI